MSFIKWKSLDVIIRHRVELIERLAAYEWMGQCDYVHELVLMSFDAIAANQCRVHNSNTDTLYLFLALTVNHHHRLAVSRRIQLNFKSQYNHSHSFSILILFVVVYQPSVARWMGEWVSEWIHAIRLSKQSMSVCVRSYDERVKIFCIESDWYAVLWTAHFIFIHKMKWLIFILSRVSSLRVVQNVEKFGSRVLKMITSLSPNSPEICWKFVSCIFVRVQFVLQENICWEENGLQRTDCVMWLIVRLTINKKFLFVQLTFRKNRTNRRHIFAERFMMWCDSDW